MPCVFLIEIFKIQKYLYFFIRGSSKCNTNKFEDIDLSNYRWQCSFDFVAVFLQVKSKYKQWYVIGVARGGQEAIPPQNLGFERRYPRQNTVARLKSQILPPKSLGWLRHWVQTYPVC